MAASSLTPNDVFGIFGLKEEEEKEYEFDDKEMFAVPVELGKERSRVIDHQVYETLMQSVETTFAKYRSVVGTTSMPNEALSRCFVNLVLFHSVLEERITLQNAEAKPLSLSPSNPLSSTTPVPTTAELANPLLMPSSSNAELCLFFETELKQIVTFKNKPHVLSGLADYSLGYKHDDTGSGNLVVVEAKRKYDLSKAYGQLLSYMGG